MGWGAGFTGAAPVGVAVAAAEPVVTGVAEIVAVVEAVAVVVGDAAAVAVGVPVGAGSAGGGGAVATVGIVVAPGDAADSASSPAVSFHATRPPARRAPTSRPMPAKNADDRPLGPDTVTELGPSLNEAGSAGGGGTWSRPPDGAKGPAWGSRRPATAFGLEGV